MASMLLMACCAAHADGLPTRPGTVSYTLALPDGVEVVLDSMIVDHSVSPYLLVRDPFSLVTLPVLADVDVRDCSFIEVTGLTATVQGIRIVTATRIRLYTDSNGRPVPMLFKTDTVRTWPYMQDLSLSLVSGSLPPLLPENPPDAVTIIPEEEYVVDTSVYPVVVTAGRGDDLNPSANTFYVEDETRSFGFKVSYSGNTVVHRNDRLSLPRPTGFDSNGEPCVTVSDLTVTHDGAEPKPLMMSQRDLSVPGGSGLANTGMLVRCVGQVTGVNATTRCFYVYDGSNINNGSTYRGVKVSYSLQIGSDNLPIEPPLVGSYVSMVCVNGTEPGDVNNPYRPVLRLRRRDDIVVRLHGNSTGMYVKTNGDDTKSGRDWDNAKRTVGNAITYAASGTEIWVASGTYNERITLQPGVALYGGFTDGTMYREQRSPAANQTILDGGRAGSVVTVPNGATPGTVIDGFAIQHGSSAYGGGICSMYPDAYATISHNILRYNNATYSGGGLHTESPLTVAGNILVGNTSPVGSGMAVEYADAQVLNNTVVGNTGSTDGSLYIDQGSPTVANNIVAFNSSGLCLTSGTSIAPSCNDIWTNARELWVPHTTPNGPPDEHGNVIKDPVFAGAVGEEFHIVWASGCRDAGDDNVPLPDALDMDLETRRVGRIDIGADETAECHRYAFTLTPGSTAAAVNTIANTTAYVKDAGANQPAAGMQVDVSVDAGELVSVTRDGTVITLPAGTQSTYGMTGTDGRVEIAMTRTDQGYVHVAGSVAECDVSRCLTAKTFFYTTHDWPMFHHDIALTGVSSAWVGVSLSNPDPAKRLPKKWVAELNGNYNTAAWELTWPSPIVASGVVYVATTVFGAPSTGWLYAFDATTGMKLGEKNVGEPIHGTPCIEDGVVYVATEGSPPLTTPGRLHAYTLQNGQFDEQWCYDCRNTDGSLATQQKIWSSVSVFNGAAYFGSTGNNSDFWGGWFHTVDLASHMDTSSSPAPMQFAAVGNTPGIDAAFRLPDGTLQPRAYLSDFSCYVTAIACDSGARIWDWQWPQDGWSMFASPAIYQGSMFVGSDNDSMYRLVDGGTPPPYCPGRFATPAPVKSTASAYNGQLYFGCDDGRVYSVDALSLQQRSATNLGAPVVSSPAISCGTDVLFAATLDGRVFALDIGNPGSVQWSYDIRSMDGKPGVFVRSSPALSGCRMFLVAGDNNHRYLYCFGD